VWVEGEGCAWGLWLGLRVRVEGWRFESLEFTVHESGSKGSGFRSKGVRGKGLG